MPRACKVSNDKLRKDKSKKKSKKENMLQPITDSAYKLLHDGSIAFAQVESNGMKVDTAYLTQTIKETKEKIKRLQNKIKEDEVFEAWRKTYGVKTNLGSRQQLGVVLFDILKYPNPSYTSNEEDRYSTDADALEKVDCPFIKKYLKIEKLKKAEGTFLSGILKDTIDEFCHPFFDLVTTETYRSSSYKPDFQNFPMRDPEVSKLVRSAFIPRSSNRHIVEVDYGKIEVHGAYWYHKDPVMYEYICNPKKDMHRDMARQCYMLSARELKNPVDKKDEKRIYNIRYCGKNMFVFPEFYGSWYGTRAMNLWDAIDKLKLHLRDGTSLKEHLKQQGIKRLGLCNWGEEPKPNTFENHLKEVENDFWNVRFKVYTQWKNDWYDKYQEKGYFDTLTEFRIEGIYRKNQVINYPVQGVAFHCLLWSLIKIQRLLNKYKMKSLIVGQIHDSIVADVLDKELKNYLEIVFKVMTIDIKKHWDFILTPLEVEAEVAPAGRNWFEKEKYKLNN